MLPRPVHPFTKTPALRLLLPLMAGILVQRYRPLPLLFLINWRNRLSTSRAVLPPSPLTKKYGLAPVNGIVLSLLVDIIGAGALYYSDIRNNTHWVGHRLHETKALLLTLQEPLVEKPASWKAIASMEQAYTGTEATPAEGGLIIYFKKDSLSEGLGYGSRLILTKPLQRIRHSGNPGAFDYSRYCLFQGITHQVYLAPGDYRVLPQKEISAFKELLFRSRRAIIDVLQTYIKGKKERGLAEALLIGY